MKKGKIEIGIPASTGLWILDQLEEVSQKYRGITIIDDSAVRNAIIKNATAGTVAGAKVGPIAPQQ